jgi:hypothetical protein
LTNSSPVVLVKGLAAGIWGSKKTRAGIEHTVEPFRKLSRQEQQGIAGEVDAIGSFVGLPAEVAYAELA